MASLVVKGLMQLAGGGLPVRRRRKYQKKNLDKMGHLHFLLYKIGLEEMALNLPQYGIELNNNKATPSPSNMSTWYPLQLDHWQLSLKYSNSATKLIAM